MYSSCCRFMIIDKIDVKVEIINLGDSSKCATLCERITIATIHERTKAKIDHRVRQAICRTRKHHERRAARAPAPAGLYPPRKNGAFQPGAHPGTGSTR